MNGAYRTVLTDRTRVITGKTGYAEIRDLDSGVGEKENILRLDVAVDYPLVVGVLKRFEYLYNEVESFLPVNYLLALDILFESNALNIFHYDVLQVFTQADIVDLNYVRV